MFSNFGNFDLSGFSLLTLAFSFFQLSKVRLEFLFNLGEVGSWHFSNFSCGPRSAHIHFILKRKLKFFLQRQVKFCRFEVKFCRFSLHTLHLERKVEVFLAGSEAGSAHILFIFTEVFPAGAARSADQRVQGSTSPDHLIS